MSDDNQNEDGSFNEDELQDLMSEIENLEKDFAEEQGSSDVEVTNETYEDETDDLQNTIDAEIAELNSITEVAEPEAIDDSEDNVVSILQNESYTQKETTYSGSPVEFSCNGEMNFNMNFSLGESTANVKVDKDAGLSVELDGVSLSISEKEGCTISLPGGIKFTVPLTSQETTANKKAS